MSRPSLDLDILSLHSSLGSPAGESMTFLNEVASRFPDAISFAAGRPYEGFFDLGTVHRYVDTFRAHLAARFHGDEALVHRTLLQYGRTKGIIHELIAEHLRVDERIAADPESIVVTVGCQEALYLILRALRRTDRDALLTVDPCYAGAHGAARLVDMPLLPVREAAQGIDLGDLTAVVRSAQESGVRPRALYLVPDFANPGGASLSLRTRRDLLGIAEKYGFLLLEDNPYGLLRDDGATRSLKSLDRSRQVVYLGSFAKTVVPGARVGYVVADQRVAAATAANGRSELLADQLAKIKSMVTVNTSPLAQAVIGGKLLEHGYSLRAANSRERRVYRRNLRQLLDGLAARFPPHSDPKVTWTTPAGGFFVLVTVPFIADDALLEHSARRHHVLWTPLHHFYADRKPRGQLRLSCGDLEPPELETGLDRLAAFIHEQSGEV